MCAFRNEGGRVEIIINKYGIVQQNNFFLEKRIKGAFKSAERKRYVFPSADREGF